MKELTKDEFMKLTPLDMVKYTIELSLESHKKFKSDYWKGSAYMGKCILETIEVVKKNIAEQSDPQG